MLTSELKYERLLKLIISFLPSEGDFSKQNINLDFNLLTWKIQRKTVGLVREQPA